MKRPDLSEFNLSQKDVSAIRKYAHIRNEKEATLSKIEFVAKNNKRVQRMKAHLVKKGAVQMYFRVASFSFRICEYFLIADTSF